MEVAREHAHHEVREHREVLARQERLVRLRFGDVLSAGLDAVGGEHDRPLDVDHVVPRGATELRVHERGVEVLGVVLDEQLPVERARDVLGDAGLHRLNVKGLDRSGEWPEVEGLGFEVGVHEEESRPRRDLHGEEPGVRSVEAGHVVHAAGLREPSVELIDPPVVRALQHSNLAAPLGDGCGAMAAHVEEAVQRAFASRVTTTGRSPPTSAVVNDPFAARASVVPTHDHPCLKTASTSSR